MTADEVKDAHDRIWAVREKLPHTISYLRIINFGTHYRLDLICKNNYSRFFDSKEQVNQFLKELE